MLRERLPPIVVRWGLWSQVARVADLGLPITSILGFPGSSNGKESAYNAGDQGSVPALGRSLGKEMATHSSVLAWKIPWTEEPGRL